MKPLCVFFAFLSNSRSSTCDPEESSRYLRDYAVREINALLWVSLIAVTFLLVEKVVKLFGLWAKARRIPGPPCPSFFGHSELVSRDNLTDILSGLHTKYGSIVKLWLGPAQLLISVKDPVLIKEMLVKAGDKLPLSGRAFQLAFGRLSLFVSSFDKEVHMKRKLLETELDRMLGIVDIVPSKAAGSIMEKIHEGSVNCKMVSQSMAFTIMGAALFGDAFFCWSKATVYEELFMMIAKDACFWASYRVLPFWKREFWKYHSLCTKLKFLTQDVVQQCRSNHMQFYQANQKHSIKLTNIDLEASSRASCFDSAMPNSLFFQELNGQHSATEESWGNIMGVMFHGSLTTAGLIANMMERIGASPEIQDKIYAEIIVMRKGAQKQDQLDVNKMHLLLATVYESARLLSAGSFLQRCSLKQDLSLKNGVTLPSGAVLVVPVSSVQTDTSSWGSDAAKFNPCRFLLKSAEKSDVVHTTSSTDTLSNPKELGERGNVSGGVSDPHGNAAFLPFGAGTRACVGQKFVIHRVASLFASLLEHYEIKIHPGCSNDREPTMDDFSSPEMVFHKRN